MKKITIYIVLALLCLKKLKDQSLKLKAFMLLCTAIFATIPPIIAQENKAVDVTLKGIQIGQKMPDVIITNLHNYKDASGKTATTAKLSDFRGKLLILDFWATWCSPCIAMIPKMDSLQKAFGNKIQFLSVTYQAEKEGLPFLEKFEKQRGKHYDLPVLFGDTELHKLFPHVYLPHYVWIDGNGLVRAITEYKDINTAKIEQFLAGQITFEQKKDRYRPYDFKQPIYANIGAAGLNPLYSSTLTGFIDGVAGGSSIRTDMVSGRKITLINVPLLWLYELAFRDKGLLSSNRIRVEAIDGSRITTGLKGSAYLNWLKDGNGYCYELQVPPQLIGSSYEKMRSDLAYLFPQYTAQIEKRETEVYALKRTSAADKIRSRGGNYLATVNKNEFKIQNSYLIQLINELNMVYQQKSTCPIIDQTAYVEKVDIKIDANLSDMEAINRELAVYDLKFIKSIARIDVLVIRDTVEPFSLNH